LRASTKENKFKLEHYSFHYDLRKYSFCPRLPNYVVDTDNLDKLKTRIRFGSTNRFYSITNQNYLEPETDRSF